MTEQEQLKNDLEQAKHLHKTESTVIEVRGTTTVDEVIDKIGDKALKIAEAYFEIKSSTEKLKIERDFEIRSKQLDLQKSDSNFQRIISIVLVASLLTLTLMDKLNSNFLWFSVLLFLDGKKLKQQFQNYKHDQ